MTHVEAVSDQDGKEKIVSGATVKACGGTEEGGRQEDD
jgi:hypothetical protein